MKNKGLAAQLIFFIFTSTAAIFTAIFFYNYHSSRGAILATAASLNSWEQCCILSPTCSPPCLASPRPQTREPEATLTLTQWDVDSLRCIVLRQFT